jgi:hypothetical protein
MANDTMHPSTLPTYTKKPIISGLGATLTLTEDLSGSTVVFDRAAGTVITLPAACALGTTFDFVTSVTVTSNKNEVITGAAAELMVGQILNCDTDSSDAIAIWKSLVATGNVSVNFNGTTQGGIIGDKFTVTKYSTTKWEVTGVTTGTSTVATPFATS